MVEVVRTNYVFWIVRKIYILPKCCASLRRSSKVFSNVSKSMSSSKERWNPKQHWSTNGDDIAIWMTKSLVRQYFIQVQDPEYDKPNK